MAGGRAPVKNRSGNINTNGKSPIRSGVYRFQSVQIFDLRLATPTTIIPNPFRMAPNGAKGKITHMLSK
ncbi:hypothetical protein GCM10028810_43210 [Spirosoma litoris]